MIVSICVNYSCVLCSILFFHSSNRWLLSLCSPVNYDFALPLPMTIRPGSLPMTRIPSISPSSVTFPVRTSLRFLTWRSFILQTQNLFTQNTIGANNASLILPNRGLAQVRPEPLSDLWFTASFPAKTSSNHQSGLLKSSIEPTPSGPGKDHKTPDERTLKLGHTLRILSPLLPNIFTSPLPNEILGSSISLHLFPSTHPHLPVVKSRVPCRAALWTAPVAWGTVPIVGNVKVEIMSEKMVRTGYVSAPSIVETDNNNQGEEKLVVRWRTEGKRNSTSTVSESQQAHSSSSTEINSGLSTLLGGSQPIFSREPSEPFTGLFIFSFDKDGKIASMTIEHADESNGFDKTSKVVTLTDWLLGKARWGRVEGGLVPGLAYKEIWCRENSSERPSWRRRSQ